MKTILVIASTAFIAVSLFAQPPQAFNYQGVARDLSGTPLTNRNIGLQISILQGSMTGTVVYKEAHNTITTNLGLFTLQIGMGSVINGAFADIDWGSGNHYLRIEMDESGGNNYQLIGASQLLSVPYALYAGSKSKWQENGNEIYYSNGKVGIGTATPGDEFEVRVNGGNGGIRISNTSVGAQDYAALRFYQGAIQRGVLYSHLDDIYLRGYQSHNNLILQAHETINGAPGQIQGNVGIGTITPAAKLQVAEGDVYIEDIGKGVIMKSPNGQCWRYTPDNTGQLTPTAVSCPN